MKILITGIGGPTPKGIAKSIKEAYPNAYIVGVDANKFAPGHYCGFPFDKTYLVPNATTDETLYVEKMNEIIQKEAIQYAFVVPETEVLIWSKLKEESKMPCDSLIPNAKVASFIFDKLNVANILLEHCLTPLTLNITDYSIVNLEMIGSQLKYPYWVRVNKSAGAIGALKINSIDDIINWTKFNGNEDGLIASTYLPGKNYACKLLYKEGKLIVSAAAERIEYLLANAAPSKISGMCSRGKLINNIELFDRSVLALEIIFKKHKLPIEGMFTVDFKEDINGIPMITEINIRHVSFTNAFALAGVNFAEKTIEAFVYNKKINLGYQIFKEEYNFLRGVDNELIIFSENDIID